MASGDVFVVKLFGNYDADETLNVFHYVQEGPDIGGVNTVAELINGFIGVIGSSLQAPLVDDAFFTRIEAFGYRAPAIYNDIRAIAWQGDIVPGSDNEGAPSFLTLTFRSSRNGPGTRYGYKRFSGIPTDFINRNRITDTAYLTLLSDLAGDLGNQLTAGGLTFTPFIVQGPKNLGTNPLGYRATTWAFNGIGTQNSRKPD